MEKFKRVYLNSDGRICRKTYWIFSIPLTLICVPSLIMGSADDGLVWYDILVLMVIYPATMINIKRAHDRDRSGWFTLLLFVPILSLWPLVELGFLKGSDGNNKYGEPDGFWNA